MADHKLIVSVPGVEKLLDMVSSGVGAVAASWLMRRDAAAQADSIRLIAQAQADARKILETGGALADFQADMTVTKSVQAGIQLQAEKQMGNVAAVFHEARTLLGDKEVPDKLVNPDWSARFFDDVKDVSSGQLRSIWARILAGEVETPGRSSLRTLEVLKNMTQEDARMFEGFAECLVFDEHSGRAAVFNPPWCGVVGGDELKDRPMHDLKTCQIMQETGLFMPVDEDGWKEWGYLIMGPPGLQGIGEHGGVELAALPWAPYRPAKVPVISATRAGRELAGFLEGCPPHDQFLACLARHLQNQKGQLFSAKIRGREGGGQLLEDWKEITGEWK